MIVILGRDWKYDGHLGIFWAMNFPTTMGSKSRLSCRPNNKCPSMSCSGAWISNQTQVIKKKNDRAKMNVFRDV